MLIYHNPGINWKIGKVKMTRCSDECRKKWKTKQTKSRWQKQKKKEKKEKFRKLTMEEKIEIARIIKKKQEEEEDLIEIIIVENVTIDTSLMQHGLRQRVMMT